MIKDQLKQDRIMKEKVKYFCTIFKVIKQSEIIAKDQLKHYRILQQKS
jgi:hypothetical protein